ncbi:MAG TPA: hypothetical protein VGM30_07640 [Puia sp.]|jgi:YD repeat-containing protein
MFYNRTIRTATPAFLFFLFWGAGLRVAAQDTTNTIGHVSIASPTAASLGKYGDIPVSYHTGIPQIGIPIYTIEAGSLKLPISLSYHASGLKVQEPGGWVGSGWALNAGGAITRTVVGQPDDRGFSTSNVTNGYYTDYGYYSYASQPELQVPIISNGVTVQKDTLAPDDINFLHGVKDGEPDLYYFNFGGYSGKFYFNDDRTPIFVPEQDFKVQPFVVSGQGFIGFIVTTPDGVRYHFGQVGNNGAVAPIEATNPFTDKNGSANTTAAASSWFLNKILSADGMDSIVFQYEAENYSYYTIAMPPVTFSHYKQIVGIGGDLATGMTLVKNLVQGVRLSQISYPNGTVSFTPSSSLRMDLSKSYGLLVDNELTDEDNTSARALGSISISDSKGFCKKDSFYLGYFFDNSALSSDFFGTYSADNLHTDEYRLRLDSIKETSCDGSVAIPPYRFTYFSEQVPRRLSFGIDHWGYPNGVDTNTTLVPTFTQIVSGAPQVTSGGYRDAIWPAMRAGSLQQITYPTGGSTVFDFEPRNIYTFTQDVLSLQPLTSYVINEFGQSRLTQTQSFTVSGTGATIITVNNHSTNWAPTWSIVDASNVQQGGGPFLVNFNTTLNQTFSLPPGSYTATLSYPSNATPDAGADATVKQWQYEPSSTTQTVGGLRIKTITNKDDLTANDVVTSYNYTGGASSSTGVLYSIPTYVQVLRNDILKLVLGPVTGCSTNGCFSCDLTPAHDFYISAGSIQPMNSLQGENVGYNEVDVSQTGNGHSVYRYYGSDLWNNTINDVCQRSIDQSILCDPSIPTFPAAPLPFEFMRDELKYEGHFNEAGHVLKETSYFPTYLPDPLTTPGYITVSMPASWSTFTTYSLQSATKTKDSIVSTTYDPVTGNGNTTTRSTYYGSPFHHQPTRTVSSTSTGDSLITNTKYAMDFRMSSCDAIPDSTGYYNTVFHNDSLWLNSTVNSCSPQTDGTTNCRQASLNLFRLMMARDRVQFVNYRRRSYTDSASLLTSCYTTARNSADALLKPILRLQDEYVNAPIEVSDWKNLSLRHAAFTLYDTSSSPIGFAYPGRIQLINLQAMSGTFAGAVISGNTITQDSRYLDESFYTFKDGNPRQVTGHDGVANAYIWDYQNKEPVAKISNATVDQVAYTSFEADGNGSWTIGSTSRDTGAITGTQSYNLSNGNCSRSGLSSGGNYIVSYWSKTGNSFTVSGSTSTKQGKTIAGWTYFEHTVTGITSLSISGSGDIDELRLYPSTAQMTTYTYSPLMGMTSQCDVGNRISYYTYDKLGRLQVVRDQDGNIIKTIEYHYKQL